MQKHRAGTRISSGQRASGGRAGKVITSSARGRLAPSGGEATPGICGRSGAGRQSRASQGARRAPGARGFSAEETPPWRRTGQNLGAVSGGRRARARVIRGGRRDASDTGVSLSRLHTLSPVSLAHTHTSSGRCAPWLSYRQSAARMRSGGSNRTTSGVKRPQLTASTRTAQRAGGFSAAVRRRLSSTSGKAAASERTTSRAPQWLQARPARPVPAGGGGAEAAALMRRG